MHNYSSPQREIVRFASLFIEDIARVETYWLFITSTVRIGFSSSTKRSIFNDYLIFNTRLISILKVNKIRRCEAWKTFMGLMKKRMHLQRITVWCNFGLGSHIYWKWGLYYVNSQWWEVTEYGSGVILASLERYGPQWIVVPI